VSKTMPLKPRLSEKTYAISEALNVYTFEVPLKVRVAAVAGKSKRTYKKSTRSSVTGMRSGIKKAYVTLKEGDKLPIYAAVEEANAPEAK
jgi:ribosomal protein L23